MRFFKTKRVEIQRQGLEKILGTLETDLLEYLWDKGESTARCVCDHLNRSRSMSFNAVNTVLNRLVDKGILKRKHGDQQYLFGASYSKAELTKIVSQDIFSSLLRDKKLFSIAGFTEALNELSADERKTLLDAIQSKTQ